jgi:hypothetical protein
VNKLSSLMMMSLVAVSFASVVSAASAAQPASKGGEYYMSSPGSIKAGPFATLEQCQASASGVNGTCAQNPWAANPANANAQAPANVQRRK